MEQTASYTATGHGDDTLGLLRLFFRDFVLPHRRACIKIGILMVFNVALQLSAPAVTMYAIDRVLPTGNMTFLKNIIVLLLGLLVLRHILSYLNETAILQTKELIILEVQKRLALHIHRLPLRFFSNRQSSYLQSRVMSDGRSLERTLIRSVVSLVINSLLLVAGFIFVLFIRYQLALALVLMLVLVALVKYYANRQIRGLGWDLQEKTTCASAILAESFAAARAIKGYAREEFQESLITERLESLRDVYVKMNMYGLLSTTGTSLLMAISAALVLWHGIRQVIGGSMTVGEVVAVLAIFSFFYQPVNEFFTNNLRSRQATTIIKKIYEFLGEQPEERAGEVIPGKVQGRIEVRGVSFSYEPGMQVLRDVNLRIEPGDHVVLIGRSGAGKSTLVNLLLGFYQPDAGEILLDGHEINSLSLDFLRRSVGTLDQNPCLFTASILENILLGKPEAGFESIVQACRLANANEFISKLPDGYSTIVGEGGVCLSASQRYKIGLARMFLKDPAILVIDDASASPDSGAEPDIQLALRRLAANRTTIVIARDLCSAFLADHVVVLQNGHIVEQGTHSDLLAQNQSYTRLFQDDCHLFQTQPSSRAGEENDDAYGYESRRRTMGPYDL